jgi:hypothetical protein
MKSHNPSVLVTADQAARAKALRGEGRSLSEIGLKLKLHNKTIRRILAGTAIISHGATNKAGEVD